MAGRQFGSPLERLPSRGKLRLGVLEGRRPLIGLDPPARFQITMIDQNQELRRSDSPSPNLEMTLQRAGGTLKDVRMADRLLP